MAPACRSTKWAGTRSAREPAPRTTSWIPGSNGCRSTSLARSATASGSTLRRSRYCGADRSIADYGMLPVAKLADLVSTLEARRPRTGHCARSGGGTEKPPWLPVGSGPRLPHPGPFRADAFRRRSATHPPGCAAWLQPARGLLHPRRTHHRPASARQPDSSQHAGEVGEEGQHVAGRGARRGHHPPRASRRRPRSRRGPSRRRGDCARQRRAIDALPGFADRKIPAASAIAPAAALASHGQPYTSDPDDRRDAAQSEERRCAISAGAADAW